MRFPHVRGRVAMVALGIVAAAAVAGCQSAGPPAAGGAPPAMSTSAPTTTAAGPASGSAAPPVADTASGDPVPSGQVQGNAGKQDSQRVFTADGGRTLGVVVEQKGCEKVDAALTGTSAERVGITITRASTSGQGAMCPMHVMLKRVTVHLDEPLGDRTVVLHTKE